MKANDRDCAKANLVDSYDPAIGCAGCARHFTQLRDFNTHVRGAKARIEAGSVVVR